MTKKPLFLIFLYIFIITPLAFAEQKVSIILSRGIIPYQRAVEGVKKKMSGFRFKEYILENERDRGRTILKDLKRDPPNLILAVGPEAAFLLKGFKTPSLRVFTMVLNPEKIFPQKISFPGVSMNYPPAILLASLKKAFPGRKKIGIFYSPELNANLVEKFYKEGEKIGLKWGFNGFLPGLRRGRKTNRRIGFKAFEQQKDRTLGGDSEKFEVNSEP